MVCCKGSEAYGYGTFLGMQCVFTSLVFQFCSVEQPGCSMRPGLSTWIQQHGNVAYAMMYVEQPDALDR